MARGQGLPLDPARLRAARTAAGLSQRQVAAALGTTRQQVIRYEAGAERPEVRRLAALARAVGVGVDSLVEEGALPAGLAGLRVGAGLTLAAAATAVRAHIPAGAGIACSRPVLADAERGVLPPTWAPPPAAGAVRNALSAAYDTDVETVAAAWATTFPTRTDDAPLDWDPLPETLWVWLCAAAAAPGATTAELGGPYWLRHLVEGPVKGSPRQGRGFLVRRPAPSGVPQEETWHLTEAGRAHIRDHRDDYARLYPDTAPAVLPQAVGAPVSETAPPVPADAELPLKDPAPDPGASRAPAGADAAVPQQGGARAVAVLLRGDPGEAHPYLWVEVDGDRIGHLGKRHPWDLVEGWVYYSRPTEQELRTLSSAELGGRPPEARTTLTDVDAAARELLGQVLVGAYIGSLHGHHTGPDGVHPDRMARWELYRGRVPGRHDIYTGSTCHGWLQDAPEGGHTAHTPDGPVTGGPWPTRGEAVAALWAHLTAPLPPPRLSEQVHARRTPRKRFDLRPMCPYTDAQLAAHRVVEAPGSEKGARVYEIVVAGDTVGTVRRLSYGNRDRAWEATANTRPRPGETAPPRAARGTREDAVFALLARPGPLWADPTSETLHEASGHRRVGPRWRTR